MAHADMCRAGGFVGLAWGGAQGETIVSEEVECATHQRAATTAAVPPRSDWFRSGSGGAKKKKAAS